MQVIIGIDPSLNSSGIAVIQHNNAGTVVTYESVCPKELSSISRLNYNYNRYYNILNSYREIDCVAYECQINQMRFGGSSGYILQLAENIGILKLAIYNNPHIKLVLAVPPGDIKTFATGKHNATKEEMIDAVASRHKKSMHTIIAESSINDVADAYHLANYAKQILDNNTYDKYIVK